MQIRLRFYTYSTLKRNYKITTCSFCEENEVDFIMSIVRLVIFPLLIPDRKCGGVLTSPSGSFGSPNNPLNYPPQLTCLWVIKIPNARNIRVTFDSFDIEPSSRCTKDYLLSLKDGKFPSSFGVRRNCGRSIQPLAFEGDRAWIEFVSDANNNYPGFQARYEAVTFVPTTQEPQTTGMFLKVELFFAAMIKVNVPIH